MTGHVPDDLLAAFVEGDVDEQVAVHIAEHVDLCVGCATRAATLEPLAAAFAAVPDPLAPPSLVPAILAELERPERGPWLEIGVGLGLLGSAGLLAAVWGDPLAMAVRAGVLADVVSGPGTRLLSGAMPSVATASLAGIAALGALFVFARVALGADLGETPLRDDRRTR